MPVVNELPTIDPAFAVAREGEEFVPYARDERLARPWAMPGTPGLAHRIGGLEKADVTGNISYDAGQPRADDRAAGRRRSTGSLARSRR